MPEPTDEKKAEEPIHEEISFYERDHLMRQAKYREHSWKQRGTVLYCESCPQNHTQMLKPGYAITGYKNNLPVIDKIY